MRHIKSISDNIKNGLLKKYIERTHLPAQNNSVTQMQPKPSLIATHQQKPTSSLIATHQRSLLLTLVSFFTMFIGIEKGTQAGEYLALIAGIIGFLFLLQHIAVSIRLRRKIMHKLERFLDE